MKPELRDRLIEFRDRRGWGKDHTGGNLSQSLMIEAAELNRLFQWGHDPSNEYDLENLEDELADIAIYLEYMLHLYGIDIDEAVSNKIEKNALKYFDGILT